MERLVTHLPPTTNIGVFSVLDGSVLAADDWVGRGASSVEDPTPKVFWIIDTIVLGDSARDAVET